MPPESPPATESPWQRYRKWLYHHEALGLYVDVSRVRFDDAAVAALRPAFADAFTAMQALEKGAIANPDEKRMVGHYWLRDPHLAPSEEISAGIVDTLEAVERFAEGVASGETAAADGTPFTDVLSIGIGGSALGPQLVADALANSASPRRLHFIDNTDPDGIDRVLAHLGDRLATTLTLITSKSGGTAETRNGMLEIRAACEAAGFAFPAHAVAVTGVGSKLDALAREEQWRAVFPMHDWIGGRTSVMSAVGLLPAALVGLDIRAMLDGARTMDAVTRIPELHSNPAALLAACWHIAGAGRGAKDMVILPYKDTLLLFSRYLQQLIMESLGKAHDLDGRLVQQGIAVYGNKGSTDQHAYVQQLRDGINNFFVTFIEVLQDRSGPSMEVEPGVTAGDYLSGFLHGTREALHANGRDSITITIPRVDAGTLGALIALYERAVGLYATLVHLNPYHQPGVEAGKRAAAAHLALQGRVLAALADASQPMTLAAIAAAAAQPDEIEAVFHVLRHLAANRAEVALSGDHGDPESLVASLTPARP